VREGVVHRAEHQTARAVHGEQGEDARGRSVEAAREGQPLGEERGRFVVRLAKPEPVVERAGPRDDANGQRLGRFRHRVQQRAHPLPMATHLAAITRPDPLGCPAVPVGRHQCLVGPFPVLRQQRGVLVEPVGEEPLDGAGHCRMDRLAALGELRAIGHLLRQGMLEGVLRLRVERRLVEELPAHQLRDRRGQLGLGKGCHPMED